MGKIIIIEPNITREESDKRVEEMRAVISNVINTAYKHKRKEA
ncbi:hypothetical protein [Clostridium paraputrificum]|nr:hypothetical protein [Clostridium paraputrificum]MDB2092966.1 hypothetical protein [Clostridium paraputrificum]DAL55154.1 MAG TPA_asm: hypothetical protein [Caudoviricetes sp.]